MYKGRTKATHGVYGV
ncbi:hypothetical protein F383_11613 [Gossypium arboreum]|uniref:Uncharacterized protein n=1 Tax=Gossypium arboreum TaxID=29729 RepID=A0A0B0PT06_GOSAR|nr:hypothetical protein F383_11613 [Gossypium arboreum]